MLRASGVDKLAILLPALLLAGSVAAADLLQVYRDALANDAQYAAARATAEAGREKQPQALAGLLPTVVATGNTFGNDGSFDTRISGSNPTASARATSSTATPTTST
jgi:outer membrane protein TolC